MKIISKKNKILLVLLFFGVINCLLIFNKSEAATASITSSKTVNVGEPVTVTGTVNAATATFELTGAGQTKTGTMQFKGGNYSESVSITFTPSKEGTTTFKLSGKMVDQSSDDGTDSIPINNKTCVITAKGTSSSSSPSSKDDADDESKITSEGSTKKTTDDSSNKSRNNYLSSLKVSDGTLSPEFNRDITSYTINFDDENTIKNLDKIKITATADDDKAKVTGTGEKELVEGENSFSIKVKSESGSTRTYIIKVTKPTTIKESDLRLSSLKVQTVDTEGNYIDVNLDKEFDANTFVYSLDVENNIQSLNVEASPVSDNIDVAVTGNENLHDGMNEVVITLTSKDDETVQTTYKIIVNKKESVMLTNVEKVENFSGKDYRKESLIITSAICAIILIIIILLIIWYKKTHSDKAESSTNEEKYERNLDNNLIEEDDVIVNGNTTENSKEDIEPKNDATISNDTAIEKSKVDDETKIQTATEGLHEKTKKKDGKRKGKHF